MKDQLLINIDHPILRDHKVYGQSLLPGLAYIDLLYQLFREQGYQYNQLELQHLSIYHPLIVNEETAVLLDITCTAQQTGQWQVLIEGRQQKPDAVKKRYVTATMRQTAPLVFTETLDIAALEQTAAVVIDLEDIYAACRSRDMLHTGFMKAGGKIFHTDTGIVVHAMLGEEALQTADAYMFNPVLIDGSGAGSALLFAPLMNGEERLFLPLSMESFRAAALLGVSCFTRVLTSSAIRKDELLAITMEFFDATGNKVGELRNFTNKLVRDAALMNGDDRPAIPVTAAATAPVNPHLQTADSGDAAAFLKELLAQRLNRPAHLIDIHSGYYEMGLDSPGLLELVQEIEKKTGTALSPTLLFEYTTITTLAAYLTGSYPASFGQQTVTAPVTAVQSPVVTAQVPEREPPLQPQRTAVTDIAVIGIAGRYPGAEDIATFWENLMNGKDCITEVPQERWNWRTYEGLKSPSGKQISRWGGFMKDVDRFDPAFFKISPREAEIMDPQERQFLEVCWETMEDAGYTPKTLTGTDKRNKVGVFVGVMHKDYALIGAASMAAGNKFPLSLNYAPIANRVSYCCNFHGPSMAVDTVCSSSLVAMHLALESIRNGESSVALAGGVNLALHPGKYLSYGLSDMHSSDGYCHTFGKDGDGYVSGECAAAVLLKPLQQAIQDHDHIYAVIKGSSINHGGTASGITVPSPVAQADMIVSCLEKTGIHPRTISYVEAHGTGTSLGDPIEIQGLVKAYGQYTADKQYCAIGSVKSNIGHAEAAAGISGLSKAVLQLYHKTLTPSLHAQELNPYIDFASSPFYVQQEKAVWHAPQIMTEAGAQLLPRRAAISSFGATGTNAHVILEEYISAAATPSQQPVSGRYLVPLSAKNRERLLAYAGRLLQRLQHHPETIHPADLAFTLQTGRVALEQRVVFMMEDVAGLIEQLQAFVKGQTNIPGIAEGQVKAGQDMLQLFSGDEDWGMLVRQWLQKGQLKKAAELWVKGLEIDWLLLYPSGHPQRISLPAYPFARERYWIPEHDQSLSTGQPAVAVLHPLLHRNTSDLSEQRYSSTFSGNEFFLADHVVQGRRILPGVAYLEMARAAVSYATGLEQQEGMALHFKNIVWATPLVADNQPVSVHTGVYQEDNGELGYEVYTEAADGVAVVHSQGRGILVAAKQAAVWDLSAVRDRCPHQLSGAELYEKFDTAGFRYGPGHKAVENIYAGTGEVLGRLTLPSAIADTRQQYPLHPALMDAALQASVALFADAAGQGAALPFALDAMEIYDNCEAVTWAYIRSRDTGTLRQSDIDLCKENGEICVSLKGLSARAVESVAAPAANGVLLARPSWIAQEAVPQLPLSDYEQRLVINCGLAGIDEHCIPAGIQYQVLTSDTPAMDQRFSQYAVQLLQIIQRIFQGRPGKKVLLQLLTGDQPEERLLAGLAGLLNTARLENPLFAGQCISMPVVTDTAAFMNKLQQDAQCFTDAHIRYEDDRRLILSWNEIITPEQPAALPWKHDGVYLITGGAGGLGALFAEAITTAAPDATVILCGRSVLSPEKETLLTGNRIYLQADISDPQQAEELVQHIIARYNRLDGIIHSAGVLRDSFILKKTTAELLDVLSPKAAGLIHLDEATRQLPLDFFVCFSSGTGVTGNVGQADYAAANAFMDAYALYRQELTASGRRQGKTLSVNWPLWKDGGMQVDAAKAGIWERDMGIVAMDTVDGIQAFYSSMAGDNAQVMVMAGDLHRIRAMVQQRPAATAPEQEPLPAVATRDNTEEKAVRYLKELLSAVIKLPADAIDADAPFENYGIDSIMVLQLTNHLEQVFGSLSKTLFFEYQNIRELTRYFLHAYESALTKLLHTDDNVDGYTKSPAAGKALLQPAVQQGSSRRRRFAVTPSAAAKETKATFPEIAVIGLAGRYPGADNVRQFWENLKGGKDSVTEIPAGRWDYRLYFDEDKHKPGKTYSKWGGFVNGVEEFDPLFFNISPREAEMIDPQERLFLQCVYETLEDAGYTRDRLSSLQKSAGVFVGVMYEEYQLYGAQLTAMGYPLAIPGNPSSIANRVSYYCNFHGPSMAIDTMCSSSLTALHLACKSLQLGECEVAVAGGVNVSVHPNKYLMLGQGKFVSANGKCESFGAGGDGYVPGEGIGAVLLKPLDKAIADNDHIYGVIRGTAVNHGGKTNGYTVPNPNAQAAVIKQALNEAGLDARMISYIEAHGTGTSLGDPIEIAGLSKAFREHTADMQFCAIGAVKSNIGHCESAAGIAGLTKVLLQMKHRYLAPSLHAASLNPHIDFGASPFFVQQTGGSWERPVIEINGRTAEYPRLAGISAFGAGGSNAHIIVEEYVPAASAPAYNSSHPVMIVLSARYEAELKQVAEQLLSFVQQEALTAEDLPRIAYTLQTGREVMEERTGFIVNSVQSLQEKLTQYIAGEPAILQCYRGKAKGNKDTWSLFTADEDMQHTIDAWIRKGKYDKLLELWVKGFSFDWEQLYDAVKPRKISLPAYPFARERYWIPDMLSSLPAMPLPQERTNEIQAVGRRAFFLEKQWEEATEITSATAATQPVIIIAAEDTQPLAAALAAHFSGSYILNISTTTTFNNTGYSGCIDLTGCSAQPVPMDRWLPLLQQLTEEARENGGLLLAVSRGLEAFPDPGVRPGGAFAAGLFRMLQSEYRQLRSRHMDATPDLPDNELAALIAQEYHHAGEEIAIAYRDGVRYQAVLSEVSLPPAEDAGRLQFHPEEVLLITGGTRGIGYLCAEHFITRYGVKKLILLGRQRLSPDDPRLVSLTRLGAEVEVINTPLTDRPALEQQLTQLEKTLGRIAGVIHSAGSMAFRDPAFIRKRKEDMEAVMSPKVAGLDALYSIFRDRSLRCFVLFSSVSAIIPSLGAGQSDYVMGNAYMDYLSAAHTGASPLVSIQWPSWKETGMGEATSKAYQDSGLLTLLNTEGLSLLDQVLQSGRRGVIMAAIADPQVFAPHRLLSRSQVIVSVREGIKQEPGSSVAHPSAITQWLLELFSRELKIPVSKLDTDTVFQDYGVDSILLAQLLRRINQEIPAPLDPSLLYEYPTLSSLSGWLVTHHGAALAHLAGEHTPEDTILPPAAVTAPVATVRRQQPPARPSGDIAVVGMSCRFAGADNLDAYWDLLSGGRSGITQVNVTQEGQPVYGGMLGNRKTIDAGFFLIPPADAAAMDPQALLLLEETLRVVYHAGYRHTEFKGSRTGVYIGGRSHHQPSTAALSAARNPVVAVGQNYLAANISQFFDLRGPAVVVDTACSSALVSLHMACQALQTGDIDTALAGGVSLLEGGAALHLFGQRGLLNNSGFFHVFDERASGVLLSEGAGMVMLKRMEDAEAAGDRIYGVIRAVAVNNDGRTPGPASPNLQAQKEVMQQALQRSGYHATDISYIEANGSGTEVTDLLELKAIGEVYRNGLKVPCGLGCIKPNIGHPLCAEGMAGLIKVLLMLYHREQVPFLSGQQAMRHYDLSASPLEFSRERRSWNASPAVAGLNCFADGGTNVHVIVTTGTDIRQLSHTREPLPLPVPQHQETGSTAAHHNGHTSGGGKGFWKKRYTAGQ
ncbi:SDR family NAD(P)-dependent oxidoreductase [Chitinophaga sp. Mgbs1]|uniref:SDR family NAD(P)-dependent oxidoreductase n=1 Tax=Chitinophaga solisilvae TaxID=1233460 RepID=A0A433WPF5_9BACT|nr:SDR family NAD(P)-dependent oxidoreductase [Chitinophaga solisilvae]